MINYINIDNENYPELLKTIPDPPKRLYYQGDVGLLDTTAVAVVGARKATDYGAWASYSLAKTLAECGVTVVSGMAYGIDSWAHKGALTANGKTIAVLGCGVDVCYPKSNRGLMDHIIRYGLVISEFEPGTQAATYTFPLRNRIISGLCVATAVVEAGIKSGSLITAEKAAEQGRDVYAIPGNINRASSLGCNRLIQDGAMPIAVLSDIVSDLGLRSNNTDVLCLEALGSDEKRIYNSVLKYGEMSTDELCRRTGMAINKICGVVTVLEMKGLLETGLGRVFIAK
jgi:DNA processing protein